MSIRVVDDGQTVSFAAVQPLHMPEGARMLPLEPGEFDLAVYRGDTYVWIFHILGFQWDEATGDWTNNPVPVDITGWRFRAEIRSGPGGTLLASLQEIERNAPAGIIHLQLTSDQSRKMSGGGMWDLETVTSDGWVKTILRGNVQFMGDITTHVAPYMGG